MGPVTITEKEQLSLQKVSIEDSSAKGDSEWWLIQLVRPKKEVPPHCLQKIG